METLYRAHEYLWQGGWVMAPLLVCSLAMWTLIGERLYFFHSLTRRDIRIRDAIAMLEQGRTTGQARGLRARLVAAFSTEMTGQAGLDKMILYHCALKQRPHLRRHLAVIAVLASVAPLLGLLGTVIGMVDTFDVLAIFGTGNVKGLASGISVALVTTQSGLLVAIPGLLLSGYLYRRAARLEMRLEEITTVLMRHV
jgi:biopolymer transport protein ExbB